MAETLVKNQVCGACGSDIRPDSLFCYHCGGALETEVQEDENNADEPSDVWFRSEISPVKEEEEKEEIKENVDDIESDEIEKAKIEKAEIDIESKVETDSEVKETDSEVEETDSENEIDLKSEIEEETKVNTVKPKPFEEKPKTKSSRGRYSRRQSKKSPDTKLKSAATLRKREKPSRLKKVEIVWEERDNSPNIWFIGFALFLSLLAAVLIVLSFYLK